MKTESATGPDLVPTRLLHECACELARPLALLAQRVLQTGRWPTCWVVHWVLPLFKKKQPWSPANYRGVHLTSQVGKTVERLLQRGFGSFFSSAECAGANQFAYRKQRGARDLLALLALTWLLGSDQGHKFLVYCSDVNGAFDRISTNRLTTNLEALGVPLRWVTVFASWLRARQAQVVVGGAYSDVMSLKDMVFQGTVWGPLLWNAYYKDSQKAVASAGFQEVVYADDLNAYKAFPNSVGNEELYKEGKDCQQKLHAWDPGKESFHVLERAGGQGGTCELLGVKFDTALEMREAVHEVVAEVGWKLRTLQRSARFHTDRELVNLYKARVLGFLEYRTPAVYHATNSVLKPLEKLQERFLREAGVTSLEALMVFNLTPLATRRDVAMLGLLHRSVLQKGPEQFGRFFQLVERQGAHLTRGESRRRLHQRQLRDPRQSTHLNVVRRSALGLAAVYNMLPAEVVKRPCVKTFQQDLQALLKARASEGCENWPETFSPRLPLWSHPLR